MEDAIRVCDVCDDDDDSDSDASSVNEDYEPSDDEHYSDDDDDSDDDVEEHHLLRGRAARIKAYKMLSYDQRINLAKIATTKLCRCSNGHCLRGGPTLERYIYELRESEIRMKDSELFKYCLNAFRPVAVFDPARQRFCVGKNLLLGIASHFLFIFSLPGMS